MEIVVENISYEYRSELFGNRSALKNVSFKIADNEMTAVIGPAGSGKTTLIQHFTALLNPTEGAVYVDGQNIFKANISRVLLRKRIGIVFQFPEMQLFEDTIYLDIAFGPVNLGLGNDEIQKRVKDSLSAVGFDFEGYKDRSPFHLSAGESRRIAIAGIIAIDPEVLILDEPTIGLDKSSSDKIEDILISFHKKGGNVVLISHDMNFVSRLCDHFIVLENGSKRFDGGKDELFNNELFLKDLGLYMPEIPKFMKKLQSCGIRLKSNVYSIDDAEKELSNLFSKKEYRNKLKSILNTNV